MSSIEIIGFLISFLSILFLMYKKKIDDAYRQAHPEQFEEELNEDDRFNSIPKNLERETQARNKTLAKQLPTSIPPSRPTQFPVSSSKSKKTSARLSEHQLKSPLETRRLKSELENRKLSTRLNQHDEDRNIDKTYFKMMSDEHIHEHIKKESRVAHLIREFPDLKKIIIYQEVFGKPKGLQ